MYEQEIDHTNANETDLLVASITRYSKIFEREELSKKERELNENLKWAAEKNDLPTVKSLFFKGCIYEDSKYYALATGVSNNNLEIVKFLVENGIKPFRKFQYNFCSKYSAYQVSKKLNIETMIRYFENLKN